MKAVLVVAHGSRNEDSSHMFLSILNMIRELKPDIRIEGAFMSFSDMNIESSIEQLIYDGVTEIDIVPYLLFSGNHVTKSIPNKINEFLKNDTRVKINYKKSLGIDKRLAEIVVDRIME